MGGLSSHFDFGQNHYETFSLVWLDQDINKTNENSIAQTDLQHLIHQFKPFDNPNHCLDYITKSDPNDRILLIVSGRLGPQIVSATHHLPQLIAIYVYCRSVEHHKAWTKDYPKVECVTSNLQDISTAIRSIDRNPQKGYITEPLSISAFDSEIIHEKVTVDLFGRLVQSHLIPNHVSRCPPTSDAKTRFVKECRKIYQSDNTVLQVINEFEKTYQPCHAISWYTRNRFLSKLLFDAFLEHDYKILSLMKFFIIDMQYQIQHNPCREKITVYRNHLMSMKAWTNMERYAGKYISIHSFLSAYLTIDEAESNLGTEFCGLEKIRFVIEADPNMPGIALFSNAHQSYDPNSQQVLFMLGSIFKITKISLSERNTRIVEMKLCSPTHHQLRWIQDRQDQLAFGDVLMRMDRLEEAWIYHRQLLSNESKDDIQLAHCHRKLAMIEAKRDLYKDSRQLYRTSTELYERINDETSFDIALALIGIGETYRHERQYSQAEESYKKAAKILAKDKTDRAWVQEMVVWNNIGTVKQEQQAYQGAIECYDKAISFSTKLKEADEILLGMIQNNLGNAYVMLKKCDTAQACYEQAMKFYEQKLPIGHEKFASLYNNMAALYYIQGEFDKASFYYEEANKIYSYALDPSPHNLSKVQQNINRQ